jgi:plastocyanin
MHITTFKEVVKMKWNVLFVILAVILLVGCAEKAVEKTQPTAPTEPQQPDEVIIEEPVEVEPQGPVPTTETVMLSDNAAEPAALTVAAGSTIVFKNSGEKVKIMWVKKTEFSEKSPRLEAGDTWEITLADAGEYDFLDMIIGKAKGTITVE